MKSLRFAPVASFAFVASLVGLAVPAQASFIAITSDPLHSTESLGSFSGSLDYSYDVFASRGHLTVSLTNTTLPTIGGFLTGFVFNINSIDPLASAALLTASFPSFLDTGNESAPPFGSFDAGAALGADWTGGGSPVSGVGIGQTGVFDFNVMASDASLLSAMSFFSGPNEFNFVVRFRGMTGAGSDKVPGKLVPAPSALALLGLAGLASVPRRRCAVA